SNMVIRLTVVTTVGLIGTITTGYFGMNLLSEADSHLARKIVYFVLGAVATTALTGWTIARSKRLSDFLEALADERLSTREKLAAFTAVWRRPRGAGDATPSLPQASHQGRPWTSER